MGYKNIFLKKMDIFKWVLNKLYNVLASQEVMMGTINPVDSLCSESLCKFTQVGQVVRKG